jgi:hypothetical protein
MELLELAVEDIVTLAATCRALGGDRVAPALGERLPKGLRSELRRGTRAYINVLARSASGVVDDALLAACRRAAEEQMPGALAHAPALLHMMTTEPGVLDGLTAARQDLCRLGRITVHLRLGLALVRQATDDAAASKESTAALRRGLRRALIAYARSICRSRKDDVPVVLEARGAALDELGKTARSQAQALANVETRAGANRPMLRAGVARPLNDLVKDWSRRRRDGAVSDLWVA